MNNQIKVPPDYIKRNLAMLLNSIEMQTLRVRTANDYLRTLNDQVIEIFCPVQIGEIFQGEILRISVKRITWHYDDSPLGLYWELSGTVLKKDGTPNNIFAGLHSVQCSGFSEKYWKLQVQKTDPSRFLSDCTCRIGTVVSYDGRIIIAGESDCPVHGFAVDEPA